MISKFINNDEKIYRYKILTDIEFAINNSTHKPTGEISSLLFEIDQKGKIVNKIREYLESTIKNNNNHDLKNLRDRAAKKIEKSYKYNKEYFDKKRKQAHTYKIGNYVMVKNIDNTKNASHKIVPEFKGPYKIARILRNDRYVINDIENHQITSKPYEGEHGKQ